MATNFAASLLQLEPQALNEDENRHLRATPLEIAAWASSKSLSPETLARIRELLQHAEQSFDVLDGKIWRILCTSSQATTQLFQQRAQDAAYIRLMREAISILNRVPPEVLGRIFLHYIGGKIYIPPNPKINPWKLGHVSSYWRNVLRNTPEMWKTIEIMPKKHGETYTIEKLTRVRNTIEDIFSRTNTTHSVVVNDHHSAPISNLISPLSNRITSLSLGDLSLGVFSSLVELPMGSWNHLETLDLSLRQDPDPDYVGPLPPSSHSSFQAALNLRVVSLTLMVGTLNIGWPLPPIFPWPQLTHLTISQIQVPCGDAHRILAQCVAVTCCNLTIRRQCNMSILTSSTIILTNLESFEISQDGTLDWAVFLKPFMFPALKHMSMMAGARIYPDEELILAYGMGSPQAITELVLRSNCSLKTLLIGGDLRHKYNQLPLVDLNIETLLHSSPTLRILIGSFILPPSIFISMQANLLDLSHLECVVLRLQTRGLRRFLDFLDYHTIYHPEKYAHIYTGGIKRAEIWCRQSPATMAVYECYQRRSLLYRQVGVDFLIEFEDRGGDISDEDEDDI